MELIEVTDDYGAIKEAQWLARAQDVHRQLRVSAEADYLATMQRIFAAGARMVLAVEAERVCGVAVWRAYENTAIGVHMYVDDLVTDESQRSRGVGRTLMRWLESRARALGCKSLLLNSGTGRADAHRFYFREGLSIAAFNFKKTLD
jgi:GNAT superfamily N-acetyltransferase